MQTLPVNAYDMAYIEVGTGPPLVCVHGTLGDFRTWSAVLGPLSKRHRVISVSLRHFFPEHWDGAGDDYRMSQHVADVIGFIEQLDARPVDLMGHSRGGHISFRIAQQRPELLRRLVLAEPGGELDATLVDPAAATPGPSQRSARFAAAADKVANGDIDGALKLFVDTIDGEGAWARLPAAPRQQLRDNATTLIGQVGENRSPYSKADAQSIRTPTLFIGGADTPGALPAVLRALAAEVRGARTAIIPDTRHWMFEQAPQQFSKIVLEFLAG
ncbi:MAG TPA: alpha/beta hydrolase [Bradyrhizobium sp.]|jgi:pimeloyl-ACP methyl ester carboxylesterase